MMAIRLPYGSNHPPCGHSSGRNRSLPQERRAVRPCNQHATERNCRCPNLFALLHLLDSKCALSAFNRGNPASFWNGWAAIVARSEDRIIRSERHNIGTCVQIVEDCPVLWEHAIKLWPSAACATSPFRQRVRSRLLRLGNWTSPYAKLRLRATGGN